MIKKFDEYVNELFSSSMKRHIEGNSRKEDSLEVLLNDFVSRHNRKENNYYIKDNKVNCSHSILIYDDDLVDGKFPFQFGEIDGHFDCSICDTLVSLEGGPQIVFGIFNCSKCENLTSLEGCPQKVGKDFICFNCGCNFTEDDLPSDIIIRGNFDYYD